MMELLLDVCPTDVAAELTGRDYLSHSAISTYQSCSLRYFFKYVAGLPEGAVSANLIFGGSIHSALEAHFRELIEGNPAPPLKHLHQAYLDKFDECDADRIRFGRGTDRQTLDALAMRILAAFQASDLAHVDGRVIGIEEELRGDVIPGAPQILARIDLLVDVGDAIVITDFKTARSPWSRAQADDAAGQLLLYHELVVPLADGRPVRLEFTVVTKAKTPKVTRHFVPVDQAKIERMKLIVRRVWDGIRSGLFFPSPSPTNCGTCPFIRECRDWKG